MSAAAGAEPLHESVLFSRDAGDAGNNNTRFIFVEATTRSMSGLAAQPIQQWKQIAACLDKSAPARTQ
jgi:hypothetical protein